MRRYNLSKSRENGEQLKKILPGGTHHNFNAKDKRIPIEFYKGKGSRIWDADGNEYLDLFAKFGAMILGHSNQEYNEALKECMDGILAADLTAASRDTCEILHTRIPSAEMVRFGLSGTEMVHNAVRLARAYTGRNKVLRFEGHFHGTGDSTMGGVIADSSVPVPYDNGEGAFSTGGRAKGVLENESILIPWNDLELLERTLHKYGEDIAAVLTEPISINGGSIMPKSGFLEGLRELCSKNNILLIFDELITGLRMGLGGAQAYYNVIPDLSLWGKCITNGGMPTSILAGKRKFMNLYEEAKVVHGGTFNGYPLGMAAVKATFEILGRNEKENYSKMRHYAGKIHQIFIEEAKKAGLDLVIQGPETCASYHCSKDTIESYHELNNDLIAKNGIIRECLASYGILVSSISRIYPNITLDENDVQFFSERIGYAVMDAAAVIKRLFRTR